MHGPLQLVQGPGTHVKVPSLCRSCKLGGGVMTLNPKP